MLADGAWAQMEQLMPAASVDVEVIEHVRRHAC